MDILYTLRQYTTLLFCVLLLYLTAWWHIPIILLKCLLLGNPNFEREVTLGALDIMMRATLLFILVKSWTWKRSGSAAGG
ncbi:hypothetical protein PT974_06291 [Cladobotryum mycophilum]|uniref:Uncharacterized protein n=1 Tax=Cladobotryum mycophilum TaxID=491253 RepID=A0ABR0SLG2_9HYPO